MSELERHRRRIDAVDRQIVDLLAERLRVASAIGEEKEAAGLSFYDPDRERRVLERVVDAAAGRLAVGPLTSIFREIISASRAEEVTQPVLVHGSFGSLAHYAAVLRFGTSAPCDVTPRAEDIFAKLQDGSAAHAVVSLEGYSLETSLDRLDLFLHTEVGIFGEFYVRPRIGLYAFESWGGPGMVFGSPAGMMQASRWIERQPPGREFRVASSVREALRQAHESGGAILGYPVLENQEGLICVEQGIEDLPEAYRRYLVLARREAQPTGTDKTSVLAVISNRPGALHRVTGILARHQINLCWLEPKATHLGHWDHLFVLELEGHRETEGVALALEEIRNEVEFLKVLGSYPSEKPPGRPF